jgi:transcriptional regulator with XRE-family HTH domain
MWTKKNKSAENEFRDYARDSFRSAVVSLFWNILAYRKKHSGFTQTALAEKIGVHKSAPSRWFSEEKPNWEENTMADIATALDVELEIFARDRKTGIWFSPSGVVESPTARVQAVRVEPQTAPNKYRIEWKGLYHSSPNSGDTGGMRQVALS